MPPSALSGHPILHPFAHAAAGFYAAQAQNNYQHNAHYYQQQQQLPETGMPHNLGGHAAPHAHAAQRDAAGGDAYDPFADTTPPPSPSSASPAQTSGTAATSKQSPHVETHAAGAHEPEAKRQKVDHAAAGHAAGAACTAGASASSPGTGAPASASDGLQPHGTDWCPGTVLMWDLDETLIVFNSLLMGKVPGGPVPPALSQSLLEKAEILESLVYGLAEDKMFFKQLEGRNCWCFAEAQAGDDGRSLRDYRFEDDGLESVVADGLARSCECCG
eukprot:Tamp_14873.p1 GENE.Tamp_14873~~Tamp_14873.p1  ORF type:complete len:274 (-),score=47.71 Tamp_14873:212-1033(-)